MPAMDNMAYALQSEGVMKTEKTIMRTGQEVGY
jgi:hypothetical protein